jgi:hypothetical protein
MANVPFQNPRTAVNGSSAVSTILTNVLPPIEEMGENGTFQNCEALKICVE